MQHVCKLCWMGDCVFLRGDHRCWHVYSNVQVCKMCWLSVWTIYKPSRKRKEKKWVWWLWIYDAYQQLTWWSGSAKIVTSQDLLVANNFILVILSWLSFKSKVDFYTATNLIHESIHWLDQFLRDVQDPGWERDQRDEFQSNDDHVIVYSPN